MCTGEEPLLYTKFQLTLNIRLKGDLLRSFPLKKSSIEEFSIEEFSTQAVPLQRGRFALPPPQDFFCPRLFLPWNFCFRTRRATAAGEMGRQVAGERSRGRNRAREVVSETGCEQGL